MAKVTVRFKGLFEEVAERKEKVCDLADPTLEGLVHALENTHGKRFTEALRDSGKSLNPGVTVFVGGEAFSGWETPLQDGDEVIFLHFIVGG